MSDKKPSPQNSQPKRKKRRVKSKQDKNGHVHSVNVNKDSGGSGEVSTCQSQSSPSLSSLVRIYSDPYYTSTSPDMSNLQNPQQAVQMQGTLQNPMTFSSSPPPPQSMVAQPGFTPQVHMNYKPDWANELIENVRMVKQEIGKLSGIEKTLSSINMKVINLETKVNNMETQLGSCDKACSFLSDEYDKHKKELESTKNTVSDLKKKCGELEAKTVEHQNERSKLNRKILDLEARSMRDNLIFHGLPEIVGENCDNVVKNFCRYQLDMGNEADDLTFDRVHRIGRPENQRVGSIRPIVAKFHKYSERETVREIGYQKREVLKRDNTAVKVQLPSKVLERRKPLYQVFEKAKNEGKRVKFVLDKLFINGREYIPPP